MNNVDKAEKKILNICKRFKVAVDWNLHFEAYKNKPLPVEVQLAIKTLVKHGMKVLFVLKDLTPIIKPPSEPIILDKN